MAGKNGKKSTKNKLKMISTVERHLPIVPRTASIPGYTIHVDQLLSQANSKLYRQGMNYHCRVKLAMPNASSSSNQFFVYTLPTDHRTIGALKMARAVYNQAVKDELEIRPSVKSPWTDFIITLCEISDLDLWDPFINTGDLAQWVAKASSNVEGYTARGISDGYLESEVTDNAGNQKKFSLMDATTSNYWNVFTEYTNFLLNRADPDSSQEIAAYEDASAVLTEMEELADKGDEPPYAWNWNQYAITAATAISRAFTAQLRGVLAHDSVPTDFLKVIDVEAPLGMIFITSISNMSATNPEVIVEVKSGNYKGVKAERLYPHDKLLGF